MPTPSKNPMNRPSKLGKLASLSVFLLSLAACSPKPTLTEECKQIFNTISRDTREALTTTEEFAIINELRRRFQKLDPNINDLCLKKTLLQKGPDGLAELNGKVICKSVSKMRACYPQPSELDELVIIAKHESQHEAMKLVDPNIPYNARQSVTIEVTNGRSWHYCSAVAVGCSDVSP